MAYKDGVCLPTPGVTAFPSGGSWCQLGRRGGGQHDRQRAGVKPAGEFDAIQTEAVSVRQVLVSGITVPGTPIGTPNVPNAAPPEACDQAPVVR